jgi:hypothetical protein
MNVPSRSRWVVVAALVAAVFGTFSAFAIANNLSKRTATNAAREIARRDCRATTGCEDYRVVALKRVSRHKAVGKIAVFGIMRGERFACRRQVVIKLDHETGKLFYATSKRRCDDLGPA